ncbi:MAG: hypothetical protein ACI82G_002077 [Bradymonadia bacterium]
MCRNRRCHESESARHGECSEERLKHNGTVVVVDALTSLEKRLVTLPEMLGQGKVG